MNYLLRLNGIIFHFNSVSSILSYLHIYDMNTNVFIMFFIIALSTIVTQHWLNIEHIQFPFVAILIWYFTTVFGCFLRLPIL